MLEDVMTLMEYELARARRYERPLSLAAIPLSVQVSARVPIRFSDLFALSPDGRHVLVMLPETDGAGAGALARRLQETGGSVDDITVVTFPDDGVTLTDLIDQVLEPRHSEGPVAQAS